MSTENEDYSDIVTYFSNLFSIKRMRTIQVDRYSISYDSCEYFSGSDINDTGRKSDFPESGDIDRIKSISLVVSGIYPDQETKVTVGWDAVEMSPDPEAKEAEEFISQLDRSTFRYF